MSFGRADLAVGFYLTLTRPAVLCELCCLRPQETIGALLARVHRTEQRLHDVHSVCVSCSGIPSAEPVRCESLDCPWLYERKKLENKAENLKAVQELVEELVELHMEDSNGSDDIPEVDTLYTAVSMSGDVDVCLTGEYCDWCRRRDGVFGLFLRRHMLKLPTAL